MTMLPINKITSFLTPLVTVYSMKTPHIKSSTEILEIDILIISKNIKNYIGDCLKSCISHEGSIKKNIYIIDDGSSDGTKELILSLLDNLKNNIVFLETESIGAASVRNLFLDNYARSEFVTFIDGDDFISSKNLETILHAMHMMNVDFSCPRVLSFDDQLNSVISHDTHHLRQEICGERYFLCTNSKFEPRLLGLETSMCMRIFRLDFLNKNKIRFDIIDFCEDIFPSRKCFILAKSILLVNSPYYYYRINRLGQRTSLIDERSKDFLIAFKKSISFAENYNVTNEQGGWMLYKLCLSAIWTKNLLPLHSVYSYIEEMATYFDEIPKEWWISISKIPNVQKNVSFLSQIYTSKYNSNTKLRCLLDQKLSVLDKIKEKIRIGAR